MSTLVEDERKVSLRGRPTGGDPQDPSTHLSTTPHIPPRPTLFRLTRRSPEDEGFDVWVSLPHETFIFPVSVDLLLYHKEVFPTPRVVGVYVWVSDLRIHEYFGAKQHKKDLWIRKVLDQSMPKPFQSVDVVHCPAESLPHLSLRLS